MRIIIFLLTIFLFSSSALSNSTITTFRGVLESSKYARMVKLKMLFYLPSFDYTYLIDRTDLFIIGDSVIVTGYIRTDTREYDYPVLYVQSIKRFNQSNDSDSDFKTITGVLHESQIPGMTIISSGGISQSYYIENTGRFEIGNNVIITGQLKGSGKELKFPLLHVQSINEFDCCLTETRGDINFDGNVNIADVIMLAAYFTNRGLIPQICYESLDINGDTLLNKDDYEFLYEFVMHCGPEPVECD